MTNLSSSYGTTRANSVSGTLACCCHLFTRLYLCIVGFFVRPLTALVYRTSSLINFFRSTRVDRLYSAIPTGTDLAFEECLHSRKSVMSAIGIYPYRLRAVLLSIAFNLRIFKGIIPLSPAKQSRGSVGWNNMFRASAERRSCERDRYPNGMKQYLHRWFSCSSIEPVPKDSPTISVFCSDKLGYRN